MEASNPQAGCIYVVATPIGNLRDLSARALDTLAMVDFILCEDTRLSRRLLSHHGIRKPLRSLHAHNERSRIKRTLDQLRSGKSAALLSDAGVPTVSDPGCLLLAGAHRAGIRAVPVPGPSAALAALSCSGFDASRFVFEGFLPARRRQRLERLKALVGETRTLIFYEAPHRIYFMIEDLRSVFGDARLLCLAKEMSKAHERIIRAAPDQVLRWLGEDTTRQKGEFTVLLENCRAERSPPAMAQISEDDLFQALSRHLPARKAAALSAQLSGGSANRLYRRSLGRKLRE